MNNTPTAQMNNTTNRLNPVTPTSEKTAVERKKELLDLLRAHNERPTATMPEEVRNIINAVEGQVINMGDIRLAAVPDVKAWSSYESKKGKNAGQQIYTCLGRYQSITIGEMAGFRLVATVSLAVMPV